MENQTEMEIKTSPEIHACAYHICRAWYNGSYTMATKPIKFLELHYTMTQFLIIPNIISSRVNCHRGREGEKRLMYIAGAKFEECCFNISRVILD